MSQKRRKFKYTPEYLAYLESPEWKAKRFERLEHDNHKCTKCNAEFNLHVHHLTYLRLYDESLDDLITLCYVCHMKTHGRKPRKQKTKRPEMVYAGKGCWVPKGMSLKTIQENMADAGGRKGQKKRRKRKRKRDK